jgi:serine/threonine protein kinase
MVHVPSDVGDGRYRLHEPLGSGSMGTVYGATGPGGEAVAVKILHEHLTGAPDVVARFKREARLAARITSPFVAPVLGAGMTPRGGDQGEPDGLLSQEQANYLAQFYDAGKDPPPIVA